MLVADMQRVARESLSRGKKPTASKAKAAVATTYAAGARRICMLLPLHYPRMLTVGCTSRG